MRRLALFALPAVLGFVLAGCSDSKPGEKVVSPVPGNTLVTAPAQTIPAQYANGDPTAGEVVFKSAGCSGCHTLAAAGATGTVGPNLDQLKPPLAAVVNQVLKGGGAMPSFKTSLSAKQIADVAAFVVKSTSG